MSDYSNYTASLKKPPRTAPKFLNNLNSKDQDYKSQTIPKPDINDYSISIANNKPRPNSPALNHSRELRGKYVNYLKEYNDLFKQLNDLKRMPPVPMDRYEYDEDDMKDKQQQSLSTRGMYDNPQYNVATGNFQLLSNNLLNFNKDFDIPKISSPYAIDSSTRISNNDYRDDPRTPLQSKTSNQNSLPMLLNFGPDSSNRFDQSIQNRDTYNVTTPYSNYQRSPGQIGSSFHSNISLGATPMDKFTSFDGGLSPGEFDMLSFNKQTNNNRLQHTQSLGKLSNSLGYTQSSNGDYMMKTSIDQHTPEMLGSLRSQTNENYLGKKVEKLSSYYKNPIDSKATFESSISSAQDNPANMPLFESSKERLKFYSRDLYIINNQAIDAHNRAILLDFGNNPNENNGSIDANQPIPEEINNSSSFKKSNSLLDISKNKIKESSLHYSYTANDLEKSKYVESPKENKEIPEQNSQDQLLKEQGSISHHSRNSQMEIKSPSIHDLSKNESLVSVKSTDKNQELKKSSTLSENVKQMENDITPKSQKENENLDQNQPPEINNRSSSNISIEDIIKRYALNYPKEPSEIPKDSIEPQNNTSPSRAEKLASRLKELSQLDPGVSDLLFGQNNKGESPTDTKFSVSPNNVNQEEPEANQPDENEDLPKDIPELPPPDVNEINDFEKDHEVPVVNTSNNNNEALPELIEHNSERLSDIIKRVENGNEDLMNTNLMATNLNNNEKPVDNSQNFVSPDRPRISYTDSSIANEDQYKNKKYLSAFLDTNTNSLLKRLKQNLMKSPEDQDKSYVSENDNKQLRTEHDVEQDLKKSLSKSSSKIDDINIKMESQPIVESSPNNENLIQSNTNNYDANQDLAEMPKSDLKSAQESFDTRAKSMLKLMQTFNNINKLLNVVEKYVPLYQHRLVNYAYSEIKELYTDIKTSRNEGLTKLFDLLVNQYAKNFKNFMKKLRKHIKVKEERLLAKQYYEHRILVKDFNKLRLYAINKMKKKFKYENAIQVLAQSKQLKCLKKLATFSNFQKNWVDEAKAQLGMFKLKLKLDKWKEYAIQKKHKREALLHYKGKIFNKLHLAAKKQIHRAREKAMKHREKSLKKKFFEKLKKFHKEKEENTLKNNAAYLHIKDTLLKKYFNLLKPSYFKQTKRKNFDEFKDYIPLQISIKDKVVKITGSNNNSLAVRNNKTIVIDVVKKK